jgi:RHS repeat-associated protein
VESLRDENGRRIARRIGEGLVRLARDPLGLVASIAIDGHAPLGFTRDALGRETRRESAAPAVHGLEGAIAAQRAGVSTKPTMERRYGWDKAFSPLSILDSAWGETGYAYDSNAQVTQARHGDGAAERFRYDSAHDIVGFAEGPAVEPKVGVSFAPNAGAGYVPPDRSGEGFSAWATTPGGKVIKARGPNGEIVTLDHDMRGRVIARRVERNGFRPRRWIFAWDAKDRLVSCKTPDNETWRYGYDPFGRRVWKVKEFSEAEARAYAQRFPGLIDAARLPDRGQTLAMAQRSRLDVDSARDAGRPPIVGVCYLWDGDVIAQEAPLRLDGAVDWDKATTWHHEPESFRPLAKQTPDGALLYIVNDHLGTPREMFDETGGQVWGAEYRLWGDIRRLWKPQARPANDNGGLPTPPEPQQAPAPRYSTRWDRLEQGNAAAGQPQPPPAHPGPRGGRVYGTLALKDEAELADARTECPIRFQGQWEDSETGLYYNRFRYYDPLAGQYLCPDPIGLKGGARPQGYVENPGSWVDPLGLIHRHHVFPRRYQRWFAARGIDIDKYTVEVDPTTHLQGIHGNGLGDLPGGWNDMWGKFIENNPNATQSDVFNFGRAMMDRYDLQGPIVPYR